MPKKIETETQILRLISKSALQVDIDFMMVKNHVSKNTSQDHLVKFYTYFEKLKDNYYDGMIITGAPVEHLEYEDVDYWNELEEIMEWSKTHVYSTLHICWGAQAGLYYHYGVQKHILPEKVFGIFPEQLVDEYDFLTNGFDEIHYTPHSRHTAIDEEAVKKVKCLSILSKNDEIGSNIIVTKDYRQIFILGHLEYGKETLRKNDSLRKVIDKADEKVDEIRTNDSVIRAVDKAEEVTGKATEALFSGLKKIFNKGDE